jgi:exoribonuclease R
VVQQRLHLSASALSLAPEFEKVRTQLHAPGAFSAPAIEEAEAAAKAPRLPDEDRTDIPFITLDPPGSTDLDQAMHLERRGSGYRVHYAIADLGAFVTPGGALDTEVHARGQTIYCPDTRVPLHPTVLSEGAASLLAGQERPALLWTLDLDADGALQQTDVRRARVRSRAKLNYPAAQQELVDGSTDEAYVLLREIGLKRLEQERARGGVSLNAPEQEVVPDGDGWALEYRATLPIEDWNAQISLLTGAAAAQIMLAGGVGVLRTMPPADERDVARLRRQAAALGVTWPHGASYADVLAALDRTQPGAQAFLVQALSLFRGAAWTAFDGAAPAATTHSAVGGPYAHVTAPLRRLVDRYGQEVCAALHGGLPVPDWVRQALPRLGEEMAEADHRSKAVERGCTDLVEAAVLSTHVGEVFDGVLVEPDRVQITDPAVVAPASAEERLVGHDVHATLLTADITQRLVRFQVSAVNPAAT